MADTYNTAECRKSGSALLEGRVTAEVRNAIKPPEMALFVWKEGLTEKRGRIQDWRIKSICTQEEVLKEPQGYKEDKMIGKLTKHKRIHHRYVFSCVSTNSVALT
jgi:hypothetical protein